MFRCNPPHMISSVDHLQLQSLETVTCEHPYLYNTFTAVNSLFMLNWLTYEQEAQLSQRNRAALCVIEYSANHSTSLKIIRNDTVE